MFLLAAPLVSAPAAGASNLVFAAMVVVGLATCAIVAVLAHRPVRGGGSTQVDARLARSERARAGVGSSS